jgi:hypothetical protein
MVIKRTQLLKESLNQKQTAPTTRIRDSENGQVRLELIPEINQSTLAFNVVQFYARV